jgi:SulP family sulfate permease
MAATDSDLQRRRLLLAFFPFLRWLPGVDLATVRGDLVAGLTGAIIVLPQGVAYALIAGLPPEYGLYTAIVTPIVAGLFGSSWHLVSGPTAAISIVVFSVVSDVVSPEGPNFIAYVLTLTFMAGVIQLALGIARMGALVNFISHTVVIGFTSGAAVLIGTSQLRHFFGLDLPAGESFAHTIAGFAVNVASSNPYVVAVGAVTLLSAMVVRRLKPRWPGMLIAMLIGSLFNIAIDGAAHGVALVGAMSGQLPPLSSPVFSLDVLSELAPGALAVAIIALIEAVSIGRAVAMRSQQRIDGNQEFIGQGLSNVVGSFFSCYAGSGSFTRTGANYDAGARTPLAAIFAAVMLALILVTAPWITAYLPMPAMGGIVLLIAWNLLDFHHVRQVVHSSRRETAVMAVTFFATLFLALEFAIYFGVLLSLVLYLQRTAHPRMVAVAPVPERPERPLRNAAKRGLAECPQLKIIRMDGSLFFGAVDHVQTTLNAVSDEGCRHIVLVGSAVNFVDVAGAELLAQQARRLQRLGGGLYLCSFKDPALETVRRGGYMEVIGEDNLYSTPEDAIHDIFQRLDPEICRHCHARIFTECARAPAPPAE